MFSRNTSHCLDAFTRCVFSTLPCISIDFDDKWGFTKFKSIQKIQKIQNSLIPKPGFPDKGIPTCVGFVMVGLYQVLHVILRSQPKQLQFPKEKSKASPFVFFVFFEICEMLALSWGSLCKFIIFCKIIRFYDQIYYVL